MSTTTRIKPGPEEPTRDLLDHAARGDEAAWTELYRRYRMLLLVAASSFLRGRLPRHVDPEDVVQSAFLSAWDSIRRFEYRGEGSFRRWLGQIVVNRVRDKVSRNDFEQYRLAEKGRQTPIARPTDEEPSEAAARLEEERRLLGHLSRLEHEEREVVLLKNFEGKSWQEVGEVIEKSERTARRIYDSAVRHLAAFRDDGR